MSGTAIPRFLRSAARQLAQNSVIITVAAARGKPRMVVSEFGRSEIDPVDRFPRRTAPSSPPMPSWALQTDTRSTGITSQRESRCRMRSLNRSMAGSGTRCSTRHCSRASPTPALPFENGGLTTTPIVHTRGWAGSPQPNTPPPLHHDGTWLRSMASSTPAPVFHQARQGQNNPRSLRHAG